MASWAPFEMETPVPGLAHSTDSRLPGCRLKEVSAALLLLVTTRWDRGSVASGSEGGVRARQLQEAPSASASARNQRWALSSTPPACAAAVVNGSSLNYGMMAKAGALGLQTWCAACVGGGAR